MPEHQRLHFSALPDLEPRRIDHAFEPVGRRNSPSSTWSASCRKPAPPVVVAFNRCRCRAECAVLRSPKILRPAHDDFALLALRHVLQRDRINNARPELMKGTPAHCCLVASAVVACSPRGRAGQAVAFGKAQAVPFPEPLCHGLRHGRTVAADIDQAAQVKPAKPAGQRVPIYHVASTSSSVTRNARSARPPVRRVPVLRHDDQRGSRNEGAVVVLAF